VCVRDSGLGFENTESGVGAYFYGDAPRVPKLMTKLEKYYSKGLIAQRHPSPTKHFTKGIEGVVFQDSGIRKGLDGDYEKIGYIF
jgi:hypothetical protein